MTNLSTLLTLADSRLPTGGHVHSGGVEEAVTSGLVVDLVTLRAYLRRRIRAYATARIEIDGQKLIDTVRVDEIGGDRQVPNDLPLEANRERSRV